MPLGVCAPCGRAYLFHAPERAARACPRCGDGIRVSAIRSLEELPGLPLSLPELHDSRREAGDKPLAAPAGSRA